MGVGLWIRGYGIQGDGVGCAAGYEDEGYGEIGVGSGYEDMGYGVGVSGYRVTGYGEMGVGSGYEDTGYRGWVVWIRGYRI